MQSVLSVNPSNACPLPFCQQTTVKRKSTRKIFDLLDLYVVGRCEVERSSLGQFQVKVCVIRGQWVHQLYVLYSPNFIPAVALFLRENHESPKSAHELHISKGISHRIALRSFLPPIDRVGISLRTFYFICLHMWCWLGWWAEVKECPSQRIFDVILHLSLTCVLLSRRYFYALLLVTKHEDF